jgi:superfamily II DNA or RNA helicase
VIRLRRWQKDALDSFRARTGPDFLAVATPGAGKTTFALTAAREDLAVNPARRLVIVAPTSHLKGQWADAAEALDLHLETEWTSADGRLPADVHGLVTTYQQVSGSHAALAEIARGAFVVLDEVHHAGDERAWGDGVRAAFEGAAVRLCLSGTPFRSDTQAIPFVRYDDDLAHADLEYGYGDALSDGRVIRPVIFPRVDGRMEWIDRSGSFAEASFQEHLDAAGASLRLRTALSVDGEWLPAVLARAHAQLEKVRLTHPDAGGLVIATDQDHARGIAAILRQRVGVNATVAVSEDADASDRITRFTTGTDPWIVAVRMISEGVDIPRLRVGVFATTTTTELFFRQAVGRLVRFVRGLGAQPSYMFIPDDWRLRAHAVGIAQQRRHSLRKAETAESLAEDEALEWDRLEPEEQLSLFTVLSAVATASPELDRPDDDLGISMFASDVDDESDLVLHLAPAPSLAGVDALDATGAPVRPRQRRRELRDSNAALVRQICRVTGTPHAQVNSDLNRRVAIERIGEATIDQLDRRRDQAVKWLATARPS